MLPTLSPSEIQIRSPTSFLDSDVKTKEVLMESLSGSSNSSSPATSKSSDMTSGRNSFQSARDRAQRLAATPAILTAPLGQAQAVNTPTCSPQLSGSASSWHRELSLGSSSFAQASGSTPPHSSPLAIDNSIFGTQAYRTPRDPVQQYGYTITPGPPSSTSSNDPFNFLRSPVSISHQVLDRSYAYGIRREDGTYTRLVPADQLPKMHGLPQIQESDGLIIVPMPRAISPLSQARSVPTTKWEAMPLAIGTGRPRPATDPIQTTIDDIVAMSPPKPTELPRKKKVYCDKWIHDGVCAFTQQGCKFKHEMPMDRQTQHELGLFNGLPAWYRRQQGVEFRAPAGPSSSRGGGSGYGGSTVSMGVSQSSRGSPTTALSPIRGGASGWRGAGRGSIGNESRHNPISPISDPRSRNQFELLNGEDDD